MYKVLLADDEPLITEGLKALIDWEDYGFEVIHISEDGEDALTFIKENAIDLLVTDIIMPKRTGLELFEEAKKLQPQVKCIVLSGYEEFNYVKKGMVLGIENYLVKPVDEEELLKTVQTVSKKISVAQENMEDSTFHTLKDNTLWRLLNGEINKNEWQQRLSLYGMTSERPFYNVSTLEFSNKANKGIYTALRADIEKHFSANCVFSPDQELLIILDGEKAENLYQLNEQLATFLQMNYSEIGSFYLSMGDPVDSMDKLGESYLQSREFSLYQISIEPNTVISSRVHVDRQTLLRNQQAYKADIVKRILHSVEKVEEGIHLFYQTLTQHTKFLAPAVARKYTIDLISYIHHSIQDVKHYNHTAAIEKLVYATDLDQIRNILTDYCHELIAAIDNQQDARSPIVQNVLDYMHSHYNEELSLKTLSQRFHINPIYLGQLFQKEIGVVFSEYINHFRLEKAKELLKTTHLRAGEIGKKVGYSDTAYFYKQFKKHVGATPTEWRHI
ncbi:response regulator transcription factor [Lederbergia sp. NSJ-179]|uniref:response regulator transcription factor n=1 Tax=Lederbergia sp. NSJ-179 TaxID=2931402 RepID=UPI001FD578B0|nr:response regulator transcription factor [Lederbergia sp. NSJ-179]MCJ7843218.1 response regulator transcription factor [Lederbergia sp. NSJ-179]